MATNEDTERSVVSPRPEGRPDWYALNVFAGREKTVYEALGKAGIEAWLPLYQTETRWSDRTKTVHRPLLPGYLFARLNKPHLENACRIRGVMKVLGSNLKPSPISTREIAQFRELLDSAAVMATPCPYVAGHEVTIARGPLAGQAGTIVRVENETRLLVSIQMLCRTVSVKIDADCVAP